MHACLLLLLLLLAIQTSSAAAAVTVPSVIPAFRKVFTLHDDSTVATAHVPAVQWVCDIMTRQNLPDNAAALRQLPDDDLLALSMRAAIAGISPWQRDALSDRIVLHEERGTPIPETLVSDLEMAVYISVVGIMAATILLQQVRIQQHHGATAAQDE